MTIAQVIAATSIGALASFVGAVNLAEARARMREMAVFRRQRQYPGPAHFFPRAAWVIWHCLAHRGKSVEVRVATGGRHHDYRCSVCGHEETV